MQIESKIEITFRWWTEDGKDIDCKTGEKLEGEAEERIFKMKKQGYTSGELHSEIEGVSYRGWFDIKYI